MFLRYLYMYWAPVCPTIHAVPEMKFLIIFVPVPDARLSNLSKGNFINPIDNKFYFKLCYPVLQSENNFTLNQIDNPFTIISKLIF
jgi:hypothetical protein